MLAAGVDDDAWFVLIDHWLGERETSQVDSPQVGVENGLSRGGEAGGVTWRREWSVSWWRGEGCHVLERASPCLTCERRRLCPVEPAHV